MLLDLVPGRFDINRGVAVEIGPNRIRQFEAFAVGSQNGMQQNDLAGVGSLLSPGRFFKTSLPIDELLPSDLIEQVVGMNDAESLTEREGEIPVLTLD